MEGSVRGTATAAIKLGMHIRDSAFELAWSSKSLQLTFYAPPILAAAKTGVASNAAELRLYVCVTCGL